MRKTILGNQTSPASTPAGDWLDLDRLARVEVTSEEAERPIEGALLPADGRGWRAAEPGRQRVRVLFDAPVQVRRVRIEVVEEERDRTQELALSWLPAGAVAPVSLVRQQYNFSPGGATREVEEYAFELDRVSGLELEVVPDVSGGDARASLRSFAVA